MDNTGVGSVAECVRTWDSGRVQDMRNQDAWVRRLVPAQSQL